MKDSQLELFVHKDEVDNVYGCSTKVCSQCRKEKPATTEYFTSNVNNKGVHDRLKHICKSCVSLNSRIVRELRKTAPPVPENCDVCGGSLSKLPSREIHLDHCRKTETFRGWLCKNCNVGIGMLGDDSEGVEKAFEYLKKHEEENG
tara:strand:- start:1892 stop:2329 length:438 start_codon:yes stop_codon:yes gene_type:complete